MTLQIEAPDEFSARNIAQRAFGAAYVQPDVDVHGLALWEVTGGQFKELKTMIAGQTEAVEISEVKPSGDREAGDG